MNQYLDNLRQKVILGRDFPLLQIPLIAIHTILNSTVSNVVERKSRIHFSAGPQRSSQNAKAV